MVQGAHALAQYIFTYPDDAKEWNNNYLIFLDVKNLDKWLYKLEKCAAFHEPDMNNELTAIACYDEEHIFKQEQLTRVTGITR